MALLVSFTPTGEQLMPGYTSALRSMDTSGTDVIAGKGHVAIPKAQRQKRKEARGGRDSTDISPCFQHWPGS